MERFGAHLRDVLRFHPASGTRVVALRAALSVLLPLLVLLATDHLAWGLFAVFGAFAAVYGGSSPSPDRWRVQAHAGVLLVGATLVGTAVGLSPDRAWLVVPAAAAVGAVATAVSDRRRWIPPGPLFAVFAVGACAAHPSRPGDLLAALGVATGTAALAVTLGRLDEHRARTRSEPVPARPPSAAAPVRRRHVARVAAAVLVAGAVATAAGIGHPYWAMVAAVAPLSAPRLRAQVARGSQRAVGTLLGVGVAFVVLSLHLPPLAAVLLAAVLQGAAELLVVRNYAAALVFITPLALLMGQLAAPLPVGPLVLDRLVETLLGTAVGMGVAAATRDRPAPVSPPGPSADGVAG
ncbi:FUSC family protein [Nocardioides zeae]|uniref:FUSC family protein n=1 Tax=Nocardioides zeae TaxID=1457234 RepID=A0A6P0HMV4_9ACTN|nr:FUSC family protein [Nocardioides zeae]